MRALPAIAVRQVDWDDARATMALVELLDAYARDPAGGGHPLPPQVRRDLPAALRQRAGTFALLAWAQQASGGPEQPVGLVICLEGFSTFACRPLVNIHDVVVLPAWRRQGIARRMLQQVEALARARGACKLTLEVLQGNAAALRTYVDFGFAGYELDPTLGQAQLMQKWL